MQETRSRRGTSTASDIPRHVSHSWCSRKFRVIHRRRKLDVYAAENSTSDFTDQSTGIGNGTVANCRFAVLGDSHFYHGQVTVGNDDTTLVFASDARLDLLRHSHLMYVDSTFRVIPSLYYQRFTAFVPMLTVSPYSVASFIVRNL